MAIRTRYLAAIVINVALPWLVYRLALPHWGVAGALAASAAPLIVWMVCDLIRFHHFDALSAVVLVGTSLSLAIMMIFRSSRQMLLVGPLESGVIGVGFLLSLVLRRPLVFYLARSTMARESSDGAARFETLWRTSPAMPVFIRMMTLVWGLGLTAENVLRGLALGLWPQRHWSMLASSVLQYGIYGSLTGWTFWYRHKRIKTATRAHEGANDRPGTELS